MAKNSIFIAIYSLSIEPYLEILVTLRGKERKEKINENQSDIFSVKMEKLNARAHTFLN